MKYQRIAFVILFLVSSVLFANSTVVEDVDKDGVDDFKDKCLDTPHGYLVDTDGCANLVIFYPNYAKDSLKISTQVAAKIDTLVTFLKTHPQVKIRVVGHASKTAVSNDAYNLKLSQKRAELFKLELLKRGIETSRVETDGKGFHEPLYSNDTQEGRNLNRRIEIEFLSF